MQFNSEANNLDLYSEARSWSGISTSDTTTLDINTFTRSANFALDKVFSLIERSDGAWQWDDNNNTDLPIATQTLTANQTDYSVNSAHLNIFRVRIKDENGNWITLDQADRRSLTDSDLTGSAGTPSKYTVVGNSIFLYPKPSYTQSAGLEVSFQRNFTYFTVSDTTAVPGFASQFHRLIALYPAHDYCAKNSMDKRLQAIDAETAKLELALVDYYSTRNADRKISMSTQSEDYGAVGLYEDKSSNPNGFF